MLNTIFSTTALLPFLMLVLLGAVLSFVVLYCNFRSLDFLGLLGFLIRQLKV